MVLCRPIPTVYKLALVMAMAACAPTGLASAESEGIRENTPRLRASGGFTTLQASLRVYKQMQTSTTMPEKTQIPEKPTLLDETTMPEKTATPLPEMTTMAEKTAIPLEDTVMDMLETMNIDEWMSMDPQTMDPTLAITEDPTSSPSDSPSVVPTFGPTTFTASPTESMMPSVAPSVSQAPSPSLPVPTEIPSSAPSGFPSKLPTVAPSSVPSPDIPMIPPVAGPTDSPTAVPTDSPTSSPTFSPTASPTSASPTTDSPTGAPTVDGCNIPAEVRIQEIMKILDAAVVDPSVNRNMATAQGKATSWLLNQDPRKTCPDTPKILQRWVLAVTYFSTGGDNWFQCSGNPNANDDCGQEEPFDGQQRFISGFHECDWAGITCDDDDCVTEIEFELNNLVGTIPTEMGLLTGLEVWGMERGGLTGPIPTEIGNLSALYFLDLDYNMLTGTLHSQLLSLSSLTQLDLNNNRLTGSINGIGVYPNMVFMQLHDNPLTGTVPVEVGSYKDLMAFTIHESQISGEMPKEVCDLLESRGVGGGLTSLIADCRGGNPNIQCDCCTDCRNPLP